MGKQQTDTANGSPSINSWKTDIDIRGKRNAKETYNKWRETWKLILKVGTNILVEAGMSQHALTRGHDALDLVDGLAAFQMLNRYLRNLLTLLLGIELSTDLWWHTKNVSRSAGDLTCIWSIKWPTEDAFHLNYNQKPRGSEQLFPTTLLDAPVVVLDVPWRVLELDLWMAWLDSLLNRRLSENRSKKCNLRKSENHGSGEKTQCLHHHHHPQQQGRQ